jgi:hypothetical protein
MQLVVFCVVGCIMRLRCVAFVTRVKPVSVLVALQMLRSEDPGVHYEAVGVIGNLVHSSQDIKQRVLEVGAGGSSRRACVSSMNRRASVSSIS